MKVRIEVVVSTAGNNEEYVGKHIGMELLGRPLQKMVVTFEEEVSEEEYSALIHSESFSTDICKNIRLGLNAIQVHSFRVKNIQH